MKFPILKTPIRNGFFFLSFFLFSTVSFAQTWEKMIGTPQNQYSPSIVSWGNNYILGYGVETVTGQSYTILFLNKYGIIVDSIAIFPDTKYLKASFAKLIVNEDELYSIGISENSNTGIADISYLKVNLNTKSYTTQYYESIDTTETFFDFIPTDSSFIVPGWASTNGITFGYLMEISKIGQLIKKDTTGGILSLSGFLWASQSKISTRFVSNYTQTFDRNTFQHINTTITSPFSSSLGGSLTSAYRSGEHFVSGYYYDASLSRPQCEVVKIVNDSVLAHNYRFGKPDKEGKIQGVVPIAESDSNTLYIIGSVATDVDPVFRPDSTEIALFKTNQNGDTLFLKFYKGEVKYIAHSVLATPDGGALIASMKYDWNSPYPNQWDIHLLKVDSLGNYTPLSTPNLEKPEELKVRVYPNPATNQIAFSGVLQFPAVLTIYDILGREVNTTRLYTKNDKVDISQLNTGTYVFRVNSNNQLARGKFLIE